MFTDFEKNNVSYHIQGEGDISVLFLHGWGCSGEIFAPIVNSLPKQYRPILVDFPGHGQSGEPDGTLHVKDFADIILRLLDSVEQKKVHIVAHSFGARVAIWIASHYPEYVDRLVITGGAGIILPEKQKLSWKTKCYKLQKNILNVFQKLPFLHSVSVRLQEKLIQKYGSADYKALSPNMRETFKAIVNEDLSKYLSSITAPTLLIWGDKDTETPPTYAQIMNRQISDSAIIIFENDDHFAFLHQHQRFRAIIEHFFSEEA